MDDKVFGISVTDWTFYVAVAAFVGVLVQIYFAGTALDYVKKDLENNNQLIAEAFRRPRLSAVFEQTNLNTIHAQFGVVRQQSIDAAIFNNGERSATDVTIELLVPQELFVQPFDAVDKTQKRMVGDTEYVVVKVDWSDDNERTTYYPNGVPQRTARFVWSAPVSDEPSVARCFWRIYDEFSKYPAANHGSVYVHREQLMHVAVLRHTPTES